MPRSKTYCLVINSTSFVTYISTNAQSIVGTFTSSIVTSIPVYNISTVGLRKGDKIALGVGLGAGVPLFLALLVRYFMKRKSWPRVPILTLKRAKGEQTGGGQIDGEYGNNRAGNQDWFLGTDYESRSVAERK